MFVFGPGEHFGIPLFDALGNAVSVPTPIRIGTMQEMSLEFSGDIKELYGQTQFANVIARGKVKASGKIKGGAYNGAQLNNLYFGQTMTAGTMMDVYPDTVGALVPSTTPRTITPTPPNSGTWIEDAGVTDGSGVPLTRVTGTPGAGQYSVAAGVYTFAVLDAGKTVFISYRYSYTSASAKKIAVQNIAMGAAPVFKSFFKTTFNGKSALVIGYGCVSSKLAMLATKTDDFSVPEMEFTLQADPLGTANVCDIYLSE